MANVGGVSCTNVFLLGKLDVTQRIEQWEVLGVNGIGLQKLGTGGSPLIVNAVLIDTNANVNTWSSAIAALVGSGLISVLDDRGITYTNFQILSISNLQPIDVYDGALKVVGMHTIAGVRTQ